MKSLSYITSAIGLTAMAIAPAAAQPTTPEEALRPYYATLDQNLPVASPGPALDAGAAISRLAFGSCNMQRRHQTIWQTIADHDPELFLMIGDNVYGDHGYHGEADMGSFVEAYRLQASHPEFMAFREAVPMLASWDDHDFGPNDSGGSFAFRERSEDLFEAFWGSNAAVRARPGIYDSVIVGPEGQRLQIIVLDTRFFRSSLATLPYSYERRPLGNYTETTDAAATMLGDAQWQWLAAQLSEPADLRIMVSSIQVLTDAHNYEKWGNMPAERERLYAALTERNGGGIVILSGDRHSGGLYHDRPDALGEDVWELTSSSLNFSFGEGDTGDREPDPRRRSGFFSDENFGTVDIDWTAGTVLLRLRGNDDRELLSQSVAFR